MKLKKLALALMLPLCMAIAKTPSETPKAAPLEVIRLEDGNTVMLSDMITPQMVDYVINSMNYKRSILPPDQTLYILIDSGGGYVDPAIVLRNAIVKMPNTRLICSYCGSAAAMIFVGSDQQRLITDKSSILMHEMFMDHVTSSTLRDYLEMAKFIIISDQFDALFYNMIGISQAEYMEHIQGKVWVLYGDEMTDNHVADQKVEITCSPEVASLEYNVCR